MRRSPLRTAAEGVALAERIAAAHSLRFHGVLGYEAQIAGLTDRNPFTLLQNPFKRAIKALSRRDVKRRRRECMQALRDRGLSPRLVNGGGTGSAHSSALDDVLGSWTACSSTTTRACPWYPLPASPFRSCAVRRRTS